MASLFSTTSSFRGSILHYGSPDVKFPRYNKDSGGVETSSWPTEQTDEGTIEFGPVNDITFLHYPNQVPASSCGLFFSEREFMDAFPYRGTPATRYSDSFDFGIFQKILEVYDAVRPSYPGFQDRQFHFSHGDLSGVNLIDPKIWRITSGVVNWEMSGFYPSWLAAMAGSWFDDDHRFLIRDEQDEHDGYKIETLEDTNVRERFRTQLKM